MKPVAAIVLCSAVLTARPAPAQDPATQPALAAAAAWLDLTDHSRYFASWEAAARSFKDAVAKGTWDAMIRPIRGPLGSMKERTLAGAEFTRSLPGAPDGEYVVIQYATRFTGKAAARETVTCVHEQDGAWRVTGYFIK